MYTRMPDGTAPSAGDIVMSLDATGYHDSHHRVTTGKVVKRNGERCVFGKPGMFAEGWDWRQSFRAQEPVYLREVVAVYRPTGSGEA